MLDKIKATWDKVQAIADVDGDIWMGIFTAAIVWKVTHGTLTGYDAGAFASAVTAFAYSNRGPQ